MIDRTAEQFELKPKRLIADTACGTGRFRRVPSRSHRAEPEDNGASPDPSTARPGTRVSGVGGVELMASVASVFVVDLEHHGSGEIVRSIAAGRGDIGIVGETIDPGAELENFRFSKVRLVMVTPSRDPFSRQRKIAFREALDREFIGYAAGSPMQDLLNYHAIRAGRRFKLRVRLNGSDLMCQMVEKGIGLAILPETAARRSQESMAIRIIPLSDTWTLRHLSICVRSMKSLPVHAQRLVEHLRQSTAAPE